MRNFPEIAAPWPRHELHKNCIELPCSLQSSPIQSPIEDQGSMTEPHPLMTPATTPPESPAVTPLPASETRQVHRCEAVKRDGSTCSYYVATILTPDGWRCYHHRPKPSADPAVTAQPAPRPPKG